MREKLAFLGKIRPKFTSREKLEVIPMSSNSGRGRDRFLESLSAVFSDDGKKKTGKVTVPNRIPLNKLQMAYQMESLTFRCVNFYAMHVAGPWFQLEGTTRAVKAVEDFFEQKNGQEKVEDAIRNMCIFGTGWLEKVKNSRGKITDIAVVDPKKIDFKRDHNGRVEEDASGKPSGYIFGNLFDQNGIMIMDEKSQVNLELDDVVRFPLFGSGNERAMGFIEPIFRDIIHKLNIKKGFSERGYKAGFPTKIIYVGDSPNAKTGYRGHKITNEMVDQIEKEWENSENKDMFIMPHYTKVDVLETNNPSDEVGLMKYTDTAICAGFGIPIEIAAGAESAASATKSDVILSGDLLKRIKSIQKKVGNILRESLFPEILAAVGLSSEVPKIIWNEISPPDLNRKAKRIATYIEVGVLTPEDMRKEIMEDEGLKYKPLPKNYMPPGKAAPVEKPKEPFQDKKDDKKEA